MTKKSIARVAQREQRAEQKVRDGMAKAYEARGLSAVGGKKKGSAAVTMDSFVNFAQRMGIGADNALSTASYGFNPITRIRTQLEWMHRSSWLAGAAVDVVADDMMRAGVELEGDLEPDDISKIHEAADSLGITASINSTIKWARLYGGCIAVMLVDGQDMKTPLRMETIGKGQFKGLLVLDRWMLGTGLNDLVTTPGPDLGLPKYYTVTTDAPALNGMKIHYSRCLRLIGIDLPYWQRIQENLWGISVLERLYDRMIAYDSASTGAAQLVYKAYIRTYKIKDLRDIIAQGGDMLNGLMAQIEFMRRYQGQEGITLMDTEDEFEGKEQNSFQGLDAALTQFGQQLSGALQIPLVRLFGQSPSGFNSGDAELRMYYDGINQQQNRQLKVPLTRIYRALGMGLGIKVPDGFGLTFKPLWQLTEKEKAEVAEQNTRAIVQAEEAALISPQLALKELKQQSRVSGLFTNITKEDIEAAEDEIVVPEPITGLGIPAPGGPGGHDPEGSQEQPDNVQNPGSSAPKKAKVADKKTKDSVAAVGALQQRGIHLVVEQDKGQVRSGFNWTVYMPFVYGYAMGTKSTDGEGVDFIVGPSLSSDKAWILDQIKIGSGAPDEPKIIVCYDDLGSAMKDYVAAHTDGRAMERIGGIRPVTYDELNAYLETMKA